MLKPFIAKAINRTDLSASEAGLWGEEFVEAPSPRATLTRRRRSERASPGGFLSAIERSTRPRGRLVLRSPVRARGN